MIQFLFIILAFTHLNSAIYDTDYIENKHSYKSSVSSITYTNNKQIGVFRNFDSVFKTSNIPSPEESAIINKKQMNQVNQSEFHKLQELEEDKRNNTLDKIIEERGLSPKGMQSTLQCIKHIALDAKSNLYKKYNVMGDREIEDFLGQFINKMVENVQMLVDFVIKLLKDSLSKK